MQTYLIPMMVQMVVPHCSILGPLLFIVYIDDLVYGLRNYECEFTLHAHDTIL